MPCSGTFSDPPSGHVLLSADRLRRTVEGVQLMPQLSFELEPGKILFFRGPSGCGKSTALRLLASLDPPDETPWTPVTLGGKTVEQVTVPVWRSQVMLVPQNRVSLNGTPLDLFRRVLTLTVRSQESGLPEEKDFISMCASMGLKIEQCEKEWKLLSGGEAQRATIAVALVLSPPILLLDEVTSALDIESTRHVEKKIADMCRKGTSVCWISHDVHQVGRMNELLPGHVSILDFQERGVRDAASSQV